MPKSIAQIITVLALLKIGAFYIPIDHKGPKSRIAFIINDAKPSHVIYAESASVIKPTVKNLKCTENNITAKTAYVIYTSGSTGNPKGVMVSHNNLIALIESEINLLKLTPTSKVLQFSSPAFDASIWEIFATFAAGACLHLPNSQLLLCGRQLTKVLNENQITHVSLPPSIIATLANVKLPLLTTMVACGETCPQKIVDTWATGRRFINAYGPTEATVCASLKVCKPNSGKPTIGRALPHVHLYVLDGNLAKIKPNEIGELYIGGKGVAEGYLNNPELTKEKFITNPLDPSEKLYKTGDHIKLLPSGELEFIGREDRQVKIHGHRIELDEIELHLKNHSNIRRAYVTIENNKIIAYMSCISNIKSTISKEMRKYLALKLPKYMLPNFFIVLNSLHLTLNGKIDKYYLATGELTSNAGIRNDTRQPKPTIYVNQKSSYRLAKPHAPSHCERSEAI